MIYSKGVHRKAWNDSIVYYYTSFQCIHTLNCRRSKTASHIRIVDDFAQTRAQPVITNTTLNLLTIAESSTATLDLLPHPVLFTASNAFQLTFIQSWIKCDDEWDAGSERLQLSPRPTVFTLRAAFLDLHHGGLDYLIPDIVQRLRRRQSLYRRLGSLGARKSGGGFGGGAVGALFRWEHICTVIDGIPSSALALRLLRPPPLATPPLQGCEARRGAPLCLHACWLQKVLMSQWSGAGGR